MIGGEKKFDLAVKRSTFRHHLYQDSALKLSWFSRRRFLSLFTIYRHDSLLVQWHSTIPTNCHTLSTDLGSMWNLMTIAHAVSKKKMFKIYTILYMYIDRSKGRWSPPQGTKYFDCNWQVLLLLSYIISFSCKSLIHFEKKTFQHFPHTNAQGHKFDLAVKRSRSTYNHHLNLRPSAEQT